MRGFLIGALILAVGALGYFYWVETRDDVTVKIDVPKVDVQR